MYMANARGTNATYIPPAHIGGRIESVRHFVGSARLFGYQHVGICSRWGTRLTLCPNDNGFALQWNRGLNDCIVGTPYVNRRGERVLQGIGI